MSRTLSLGDLLEDRQLGLELVTTDAEQLRRPVRGAHSIEIEQPSTWLERDWLMLTAGVVLQDDEQAQRRLVAELDDAGMTGIGFGVGVYFPEVPAALVEAAEERGFPIFRVPFPTSFGQVEAVVHRSLLSSDLHVFRRLAAMQHHLLDSFGDEQPHETVIERLAGLVDASVAIVGPSGRPERVRGRGPWEAIWGGIVSRPHTILEFDADGWQTVAVPISGSAVANDRWLVVTRRHRNAPDTLTKPVAQITAPLLAALTRLEETERRQDRATRASLLERLLEPLSDEEAGLLVKRMSLHGFDPEQPARVLAIRDDPGEEASARMEVTLPLLLEARGLPFLACERDGLALALVQAPLEELRELVVPRLEATGSPDAVAGCGRPVTGALGVAQSARDATLIANRPASHDRERWSCFEDLDLDLLLLSEAEAERIQPKVDEIFARLDQGSGLRETVVAYFEHDLDVGRAALALGLHPNSVRYRLGRAEEALGRSLRSPSTIAAISIALAVERRAAAES